MRIADALIEVLKENESLTYKQAYIKIVEKDLYKFGANDPESAVNAKLRCHCVGLDFPGASPVKYFKIVGKEGTRNLYALASSEDLEQLADTVNSNKENILLPQPDSDYLPEERIDLIYSDYKDRLKKDLLNHILGCHPSFFEKLVVSLLLEMGYGSDKQASKVLGRAHDGGIDGVIYEDRLELSRIYIQAKRNDFDNTIGRPLLQAFVGAMQDVQKGVFITTSSFTKEAIKYAESQQQKSLKLVDGEQLAELMIRYGIGLEEIQTYKVYKINGDYFE
jgi:restriction system protein